MQALLLNNLSLIATEQGDYAAAQHYLQRGLELAIASGNLTVQSEIYTSLGRNDCLLGNTASALMNLEQGRQLAESLGYRSLMATAMRLLAEIKWRHDDAQGAEALYSHALSIAKHHQLPVIECELLLSTAEFLSSTNRNQAKAYSGEAVALAESLGKPQLLEQARRVAARLDQSGDSKQQNLPA